jgi:uncharacterized oxidoreductase
MPIVLPDPLRTTITQVFLAVGVPEPEAALVAEHLVEAELAGVTSHGVIRVPQYVEAIRQGQVVPDATVTVRKEALSAAVLDGHHGFGQVTARQAMDRAVAIADRTGIGAVTLVNCSHTGRLGSYTEHAARRGKIGLMMVNAGGHGQWVAPFGGTAGRLSTNPFSIAVPTGSDFPLVLDIATSAAPEGKVRALRAAGQPVPEGWVITAAGSTTTDPADLYGPPRGALLPFGGHKGFGLAFMIDALAGGLSGAGCCCDPDAPLEGKSDGVFLLAIHVEAFCAPADFQEDVRQLIAHVKSSPPQPGVTEVFVPGELEARRKQQRLREGIPIDEGIWQSVVELASPVRRTR